MNLSMWLLGLPYGMATDSKKAMETAGFLKTGLETGTVSLLPHSVDRSACESI